MKRVLTLLVTTLVGLAPAAQGAPQLYKYQDADGVWHYSDRVPPEDADRAHRKLNEQGIEIGRRERAPTPEELARQQELARLRAEQQRILEEQQKRDEVLKKTYRNEEDILLARDGKLQAVDSYIRLTEGNIKRLKARLAEMQHNAALLERRGEAVNPTFRQNIEDTRRQIEDNYAYIVAREEEKLDIREHFDRDLTRFRQLDAMRPGDTDLEQPFDVRTVFLETLVACDSPEACERYWTRARQFAKQHATTPLLVSGDRILMMSAPADDQDLSLTVSRIPGEDGKDSIFLDIQCRDTTLGREHCAGAEVQRVRNGFRPAVTGPVASLGAN